jgi:4-diphosphocytidyl-2-C-methyl-D-erythritol kinase
MQPNSVVIVLSLLPILLNLDVAAVKFYTPTPVSLKDLYLVIVKPPIHVSTAEAYAGVKPKEPSISLAAILESPITSWKEKLTNDFEESVFKIHPQINKIKDELYRQGALYASMSGSGAAVFGIFNDTRFIKKQF